MGRVVERVWRDFRRQAMTPAQRRPFHYQAYIPNNLFDLDLLLDAELAAHVADTERAILLLNADNPRVASFDALARLLLRAESAASSRIEGLEVGPRRLANAEAAERLGVPIHDVTAEAVLGNIDAMTLAVTDLATRPLLSNDDLLATHRALMQHTDRPDLGGIVRATQNWIGGNGNNPCGAEFVPPPPEVVPALLDDLVLFLNSDRFSPLVQAALAHAQFELIHPFGDGNGRTARALAHVIFRRRALAPRYVLPVSLIFATRSREYTNCLRAMCYLGSSDSDAAQAGIASWISMFASASARAASAARQFGAQIESLVQLWRDLAQPVRAGSTVERLLWILPSAPIITVETAARLVGRSFQATNEAIDHLVQAGVLRQTTIGRRNRAFEAVGLISALIGFERGLASSDGDTRVSSPVRPVPYRSARTTLT